MQVVCHQLESPWSISASRRTRTNLRHAGQTNSKKRLAPGTPCFLCPLARATCLRRLDSTAQVEVLCASIRSKNLVEAAKSGLECRRAVVVVTTSTSPKNLLFNKSQKSEEN